MGGGRYRQIDDPSIVKSLPWRLNRESELEEITSECWSNSYKIQQYLGRVGLPLHAITLCSLQHVVE